ncbi:MULTISPECIES: FAD-dependent monooxygenase [Streptomycetaceae]|uniref:Monooxygenase FAD-binding protein n=1 Tax=Streptantibioticus cattleyicolor (strain ATCC 35852 / DSM 46488 / JCM 4925 / NBRC 14057 / NRRL 8057) TaxID=1003195 RepID=F8JSV0_STREN|nr:MULTISPECIES: FAD-dependent monooxygenase [Streptomycetaceae]AEW98011.1 monooxygenase FAD-binding protein [Streptantibioticus cattleyicolor NRRL 8057 = DSM 46488]MYS62410.1 FAD-dependent oxidoreductase [Streptomyces sp. SID5468]CCB78330.1 2-polyprenyl-6-methoxyphenol hydroxylase-like oxidoreductase [Streptantibioticus cattleyicolor NRRL 8057 = DSM 46488]
MAAFLEDTDVIVVGAGPTGLTLAGELAAAGVRTTVLERRGEESNLTRAFAVHARTLELLDARGLADELIATGTRVRHIRFADAARLDLGRLPSRFPYVLVTPQYNVERVLRQRAEKAGARLVTGAEVCDVAQDASGVEVRLADGRTVRASYAVGADGVRSRVRQALGLPFPGVSVVRSMMLADVRLAEPPGEVLTAGAVGDCFAFTAPFGDGWYRVFAWDRHDQRPDDAPVDPAQVRDVLRRALGSDLGMGEPRWLSRFHSDERQVPRYRTGRVFLAGDAAHTHSPAGGQGMNTGIQDAFNLGWKLAAVLAGRAPDALLDTYHGERHPVGKLVLRSSGALVRMVLLRTAPQRAARTLAVRAALAFGPTARKVLGTVSGAGIDYRRRGSRGAHPLTGARAVDVALDGAGSGGPGRLYEALREGTFVLLGPATRADVAAPWADRVRWVTPAGGAGPVALVRPDGYVAWAASAPFAAGELRRALTRWCGPVAENR